jgi:hypothetical protein
METTETEVRMEQIELVAAPMDMSDVMLFAACVLWVAMGGC